ncbi:MAG TPA: HNH endonuclease signature motif containing protein, partial [Streptosporangiaceae bacterium]
GAGGGRGEFERRLWPRLEPEDGPIPGLPLAPIAAPGEECDASIVPIVSGQVDQDLLDQLVALLNGRDDADASSSVGEGAETGVAGGQRIPADVDRVRGLIVANAAALLSGPRGLASWLRTQTLTGPGATVSLPLDLGKSTEVIPPHLRRAVILRDRHCAAPGCQQPPAACQVHHIRPRRKGGRTKLSNLLLLCTFHHLILVHEWDWTITLNPDGTTTMTSPDGSRVYHSHGPPPAAAA